jgi:hypothetical protein
MRTILAVALLFAALTGTAAAGSEHQVAVGPLTVPRWADGGPVAIEVTVTNLGTVREDYALPGGALRATIAGHGSIEFPGFSVAPGGARTVRAVWQAPPLVCLCRVRLETTNRHGQPIVLQQRILVFPVRVVGGGIVAVLGLAALVWLARTRGREEPEPAAAEEEPAHVPDAVRGLPRAEELPDWFVRLRTGAPLEPEKRRGRGR